MRVFIEHILNRYTIIKLHSKIGQGVRTQSVTEVFLSKNKRIFKAFRLFKIGKRKNFDVTDY